MIPDANWFALPDQLYALRGVRGAILVQGEIVVYVDDESSESVAIDRSGGLHLGLIGTRHAGTIDKIEALIQQARSEA